MKKKLFSIIDSSRLKMPTLLLVLVHVAYICLFNIRWPNIAFNYAFSNILASQSKLTKKMHVFVFALWQKQNMQNKMNHFCNLLKFFSVENRSSKFCIKGVKSRQSIISLRLLFEQAKAKSKFTMNSFVFATIVLSAVCGTFAVPSGYGAPAYAGKYNPSKRLKKKYFIRCWGWCWHLIEFLFIWIVAPAAPSYAGN